MAYIGSMFFVIGSFVSNVKRMRYFYLVGALVFVIVFAQTDLSKSENLANLLLNSFNVILHVYNLSKNWFKERKNIKLHNKAIQIARVA
jgi:hypothetical protein